MAKYHCEFCNKKLLNDKLKSRAVHNRGAKHLLMKKAYYMEVFDQKRVQLEMSTILRDMTGTSSEEPRAEEFKLPPGIRPEAIHIPETPARFKLPPNFDFRDRRNFPADISTAIRKYIA
jgi:U1 small nuclear ribonucleoprotein C